MQTNCNFRHFSKSSEFGTDLVETCASITILCVCMLSAVASSSANTLRELGFPDECSGQHRLRCALFLDKMFTRATHLPWEGRSTLTLHRNGPALGCLQISSLPSSHHE